MTDKSSMGTEAASFLQDYHQYGYHIEPNVFNHEQCDALIAAAQRLSAAQAGIFKPAMMPHRDDANFLQAMKNNKITKIISQIVESDVSGLQTEFFYCKPGTRGFSLHQDNFFVEAPLGKFVSAWTALTDVTPENGGLIVYPGSHKEGTLPVRKLALSSDVGQDPNANNEETVVPQQYQAVNVSVPKGATLFIHGHLVHGSNSNLSETWRYVLLATYIAKGRPFRAGRYAKREEVALT